MSENFTRVGLEKLAAEDLVKVYGLFCSVYGFKPLERDETFIRNEGIAILRNGLLDYRPFMGTKFFGHRSGDEAYFSGYTGEDMQGQENERFQNAVKEYFERKLSPKSRKKPG